MRIIFFLLLFSLSSHGFTANWMNFGQNKKGSTFYVDVENIKLHDDHVYYFMMINYPELTKIGTYSNISEYKIDCVNQKQTWLSNIIYSKPMAQGKVITEKIPVWNHYGSTLNETRYLESGSIEHRILLYVCGTVE